MTPANAHKTLRQAALDYPDAYRETPWGEEVMKVRRKVFVFVGQRDGGMTMTTKLPESRYAALGLEFTAPCGYGLGKSGWITSSFKAGDDVPVELLLEWLDESYRAVAPKTLVKRLAAGVASADAAPAVQLKGKVLLAGEDRARLERAQVALEAHGLTIDTVDYAGLRSVKGARDLVVIDLNRRFTDGLALVKDLAEFAGPAVFTGVREKRQAGRIKAAVPGRPAYKHAPGEASMIAALVLILQG